MRRWFYLLFAFVVLLTIAVVVYIFFFAPKTTSSFQTPPTNPFGQAGARIGSLFVTKNQNGSQATSSQTEVTPGEEQLLLHVWDKPVAGYVFVERPVLEQVSSTTTIGSSTVATIQQIRATSSSMLFTDRMTGYVYEYIPKLLKIHQVSNTRMPGVYSATFFANGTFVLFRTYDEGKNAVVSTLFRVPVVGVNAEAASLEKIINLPNNIVSISVNRTTKQLSFLAKTASGSTLYSLNEDSRSAISESNPPKMVAANLPFSSWNLAYGGSILYMTTKASAFSSGYLVEAFTGKRIVSDKTGLVVSPSFDENTILYSMNARSGLLSFLFNKKTGATLQLPIKTIASKCGFENNAAFVICGVPSLLPSVSFGYPNDWYQGKISFSDNLYRLATDGSGTMIIELKKEAGEPLDLVDLSLNAANSLLGFINKKDFSLWLANFDLLGD